MSIKSLLLLGCLTSLVFAESPEGCLVGQVTKGTPAETAGIKTGDIIVKAGQQSVGSVEDLQKILAKGDDAMDIQILRESTPQEVHVVWPPESVDHRLGIRCGPVPETGITSSTAAAAPESGLFKAAKSACPYATPLNSSVQVKLADGSSLNGTLLACDGGEIALRTGLLYRVFKLEKITSVTPR